MKKCNVWLITCLVAVFAAAALAQTPAPAQVVRTITKTDKFDFSSGGSIIVNGAPNGSISITGTSKNEVEIVAEIELHAASEADLAKLAEVTGFITDESPIRTSVITVGVHNKFGLKKLPKAFPKNLLTLPFSINYKISVPRYSDLEIDGGKGDLSIINVEGSMQVNFIESKAYIEIVGGNTSIKIGTGSLDVAYGVRGWRGRASDISLANGDMKVRLPSNMSAEIDATIVKAGSIENTLLDLKPRDRKVPFTEKSIMAKAGAGGAPIKFAVGSGTMKLERLVTNL